MSRTYRLVRVSAKGQVVIPLTIRQRLGIRAGDRLIIVGGEHEAVLMTAKRYAESLRGLGREVNGRTRQEVDAYVRGLRRTWEK